jgi:hypothetical protein
MRFFILIPLIFLSLNAQNVGVNTSTPHAALDVNSTGNSASTKAVSVSNSASDTLFVIQDNGNVGIGTAQPGAPLDVQTQGTLAARFNAPVEGQPAVNSNELVTLGQLQAVSAGGSGGGQQSSATMWSTQSSGIGYFTDGLIYCRQLTEGGFTDWRMPTVADFTRLIQDSSIPLPSYPVAFYWLDMTYTGLNSGSTWMQLRIDNSNLSVLNSHYLTYSYSISSNTPRTFCVR